jgi:hypothetical protein
MAMALGTTSSFKGDPRMVGRELKVAAVVQGKIDKRGDMLIIDADLVNAATGAEVWQGRYRRHTEAQSRYRPQRAPSRRSDSGSASGALAGCKGTCPAGPSSENRSRRAGRRRRKAVI